MFNKQNARYTDLLQVLVLSRSVLQYQVMDQSWSFYSLYYISDSFSFLILGIKKELLSLHLSYMQREEASSKALQGH